MNMRVQRLPGSPEQSFIPAPAPRTGKPEA